MIPRVLRMLMGCCGLALLPAAAPATQGISTTFVKVLMKNVPLGKPQPMISKSGAGITVTNLGDDKISVIVDILTPSPAQLRSGAEPVPDIHWIQIAPRSFELEGRETYTLDGELTVPNQKAYRSKYYQAMIWIHSTSDEAGGLAVSGGLLTRFRFKTAPR